MRIALITPGFSAHERDWCIPVLLNLVLALARDHDVHVFTLRYPHFRLSYMVGGARVHAFGGADTSGAARLLLLQRALRRIRRQHRDQPFDVVHGFWADEPGILAATFGRLAGVPSLVSIMGGELVSLPDVQYGGQLGVLNPWLTSLALRDATRVTAGSRYLEEMASRSVDPARLVRLPLGVDTGRFTPEPLDWGGERELAGCPAILSVGSLESVKDHLILLDAVASLSAEMPGIHLHLVGDGRLKPELQMRARSLGMLSRVTFHGSVSHHCLPGYYRGAHLFVSSSRHESQGLAALEAAACGCPVIGTAVGILPELSPPSGSIATGDSAALADGMRAIVTDRSRRDELRDSALELVRSELSLAGSVRRLSRLYRSIAGGAQSPRDEHQNDDASGGRGG